MSLELLLSALLDMILCLRHVCCSTKSLDTLACVMCECVHACVCAVGRLQARLGG